MARAQILEEEKVHASKILAKQSASLKGAESNHNRARGNPIMNKPNKLRRIKGGNFTEPWSIEKLQEKIDKLPNSETKKKVLFVGEASFLKTGFSTYWDNAVRRLHKTGKYEIAEIGSYAKTSDPRAQSLPWKFYGVIPEDNDSAGIQAYKQNYREAQFGRLIMDNVLADFKPHIVCTPPGNLVMTENGYIPIEDVKIGDRVLTHTGKFQRVTKLYKRQHEGEIYNIYSNGICDALTLTGNHPVYIYRNKKQTAQKKSMQAIHCDDTPEFIAASKLQMGDITTTPRLLIDTSPQIIDLREHLINYQTNDDMSISPFNGHNKDNKINPTINITQDMARLLGYIVGDGSISDRGNITISFDKEQKHLVDDAVNIAKNIGWNATCDDKRDGNWTFRFNSIILAKALKKLLYNSPYDWNIPKQIWHSPTDVKQQFLSGLIRSDGSYRNDKKGIQYITVNKKMAYNVRLLWLCCGYAATITNCKGHYAVSLNSQFDTKQANKFIQKYECLDLDTTENIIRQSRRVQILNDSLVSRIRRIRKRNYNGIVYNLEVENDESYVLQSCVHNCTLTDWWMAYFWADSALRDRFHWVYMACVDSYPQKWEWINTYGNVDTLLAYSHFGKRALEEQSRTYIAQSMHLKPLDVEMVTQPGIDNEIYKPVDKKIIKEQFGIPPEIRFIGMVSRNQKRKLFPRLIESFRMFKDQNGWQETDPRRKKIKDIDNIKLLLHTCVKDVGFDIPEAIRREGLQKEVLFSYICTKCGACAVSLFAGHPTKCPKCGEVAMITPNTQFGYPDEQFAKLFNLFDVYVQASIAGACLPAGEQIITENGYKNIEVIQVGEKVLTSENTFEKVVKTNNRQYTGDIISIQPHYINIPTKTSADHKILAIDKQKHNIKQIAECNIKQAEWINAEKIDKNNHILLYPCNNQVFNPINKIDIANYIDKNNYEVTETKIIVHGRNQFGDTGQHCTSPKINRFINITPDFARLIGYWIAEGSLNGRTGEITFAFNSKEVKYHNDVINLLKDIFNVQFIQQKCKKNTTKIIGSSKILAEFLKSFCGRIGTDRFINRIFKEHNENIKSALLAGMWRGDGSNYTLNNGIIYSNYSTSSEQLAFDVFNMLLTLGYIGSISKNKRNNRHNSHIEYSIRLYGEQVNKFINSIGQKCNKIIGKYSDKKLNKAYKDNNYLYLQINNIDKKYVENTTIYNVDIKNYPSYVSSFIVHNSEMTIINSKAVGVPTIVTNYAAMAEQGKNGGGALIKCDLETEAETMQWRAWFDRQSLVDKMTKLMKKPKILERLSNEARRCAVNYYDWELTAKKWEYILDKTEIDEKVWDKKVEKLDIPEEKLHKQELSNEEFVNKCYKEILHREPDRKGRKNWLDKLEKGAMRDKIEKYFRDIAKKNNVAADLLDDTKSTNPIETIAKSMDDKDTFRILYCMPETAGDVLISTAIVTKLQDEYPDASIYFATQPQYFDIIKDHPAVHGVVEYHPELLNYRTPEHFGPSPGFVDMCLCPFIITQKIPHWIHSGHGESLGVSYAHMCNLTMTDEEIEEEMLINIDESINIPENKYITFHRQTTQDPKDYERWEEVLPNIKDLTIVQVGAKDEPLVEHDNIIDMRGKTTPQQLAHLIVNAELHLGLDSFPSHVARAVGTKSVVLYGGTYAKQGGIQNGISLEPGNRGRCVTSCHLEKCILKEKQIGDKCINNIMPEEVLEILKEQLGEKHIVPPKPLKLSAYCIIKDGDKYHFPYEKCINAACNIVDEFIMVDGGSTDGTWENLQKLVEKNAKLKIVQHSWDMDNPMLMGDEKTYAREQCTGDYLIQLDADEILREPQNGQIRNLVKMNRHIPIFNFPSINLFKDQKTLRIERPFEKWRISKNDENIVHGVHGEAREFDPETTKVVYDKKRSDSCEYIDKNTLKIMPNASITPPQALQLHATMVKMHEEKKDIQQDMTKDYTLMIKEVINKMPHTLHLSWNDTDVKQNRGEFWDKTWHGKNSWTHNSSSDIKERLEKSEDLFITFDEEDPFNLNKE